MAVTARADLAAVSLAHGQALARLLRAQGYMRDAAGLDAALATAFRVLAAQVGRQALSNAVARVSAEVEDRGAPASARVARHH